MMPKKEDLTNHLDIGAVLAIVWKRKWLLVLPMVLVGGFAFGGSYLLTPNYEASTIIQIDAEAQLSPELQRLMGKEIQRRDFGQRNNKLRSMYNEIISLRYTDLLNERLHLTNQPQIEAGALAYVARQPSMTMERARLIVLQNELKNNLQVNWASGDQIQLFAHSLDPVRARDLANTLGDIFIKEKIKQELSQIRSSQNFSDLQLEKYETKLDELITRKTNLEKEVIALQFDDAISSESNREEISSEIDNTHESIGTLRTKEQQLISSLHSIKGLELASFKLEDSRKIKKARNDLKEELRKIGDLMIKYSWSDPQIISFKLRLRQLLGEIYRENANLVDAQFASADPSAKPILKELFNVRSQLAHLYSKKPYLEAAQEDLTSKVKIIPEKQATLDQIIKEIEATTDIRDKFKRQQESSTISQALVQDMSNTKYRVVEPAKIPFAPFEPDRKQIAIMGIVLGLVLGGVAVLLIELLDKSFKDRDDIEETLALPVLGIVPRIDAIKKL